MTLKSSAVLYINSWKNKTHTHQLKSFHLFCQLVNWLWCPKLSKRHCCAFALHWIVSIVFRFPLKANSLQRTIRAPGQLTKQLNLHLLGVNCVCSHTCANTCTPFHVLVRQFKWNAYDAPHTIIHHYREVSTEYFSVL